MRQFLSTSLIALALLVSATVAIPAAHAQSLESQLDANGNPYGTVDQSNATLMNDIQAAAAQDKSAASQPTTLGPPAPSNYEFTSLMSYIVQLFAWLLGVAAIVLDNAVYYTIVKMGSYVSNLSAVGVTWRILRDIGNIALIFGFLAAGIATILNTEFYGFKSKMLPMLLIGAIFLNFSLFISEAVIDTGNLFATQFYQQINGGQPAGAKTIGLSSINNEGISNKVMASLGLQTIYGAAQKPESAAALLKDNAWTIGFMSIILFLIAAFVFFSLAFVLIARFIYLLYLIITAPIGFAGLAVPKLDKLARNWWGNLFEQTVTAPVLLLLLYVALRVITDTGFLTGFSDCVAGGAGAGGCNASYVGFANNNFVGFASVVLSFFVAMGLLLAVVIASKKLSAWGGGWATRTAGKLTFGAAAWAGRNTVGWGTNDLSRKVRSSRLATIPIVGRSVLGVLDKGAKASFDVRGAKIAGGLKGGLDIDAGKAKEGGARKAVEEAIKAREEHAKSLTAKEKTGTERQAIWKAEQQARGAEASKQQAQEARNRAQNDKKNSDAELTRIEEERKQDRYWDTNPENIARLDVAVQAAKEAAARERVSELAFKEAEAESRRTKAEEDTTKATIARRTGTSGELQRTYAQRILWGPGKIFYRNTKAADNIMTYAGKSKDQHQVDAFLDALKKNSTPPPAPAPTAPAPSSGGTT